MTRTRACILGFARRAVHLVLRRHHHRRPLGQLLARGSPQTERRLWIIRRAAAAENGRGRRQNGSFGRRCRATSLAGTLCRSRSQRLRSQCPLLRRCAAQCTTSRSSRPPPSGTCAVRGRACCRAVAAPAACWAADALRMLWCRGGRQAARSSQRSWPGRSCSRRRRSVFSAATCARRTTSPLVPALKRSSCALAGASSLARPSRATRCSVEEATAAPAPSRTTGTTIASPRSALTTMGCSHPAPPRTASRVRCPSPLVVTPPAILLIILCCMAATCPRQWHSAHHRKCPLHSCISIFRRGSGSPGAARRHC
mmetsp:Transcript_123223/g.355973  ORF Transcript_123223/g.355973 Transcript_123223/m.355973 type:complete len:312 (-) Transcript_123223:1460-2395(-)